MGNAFAPKFGTRTIKSIRCEHCRLPGLLDQAPGHKCHCGGTLVPFVAELPNDCAWCTDVHLLFGLRWPRASPRQVGGKMTQKRCYKCRRILATEVFRVDRAGVGPMVSATCSDCRVPSTFEKRVGQRAAAARDRAKRAGAVADLTAKEAMEVLTKADGRCFYCQRNVGLHELVLDHFVPIEKKGGTTKENMVAACAGCNRVKCKNLGPLVQWNRRLPIKTVQNIKRLAEMLGTTEVDVVVSLVDAAISISRPAPTPTEPQTPDRG